MSQDEKQELKNEITEGLLSGDIETTADKMKDDLISDIECDTIIKTVFKELMDSRKVERAITIFQKFELPLEYFSREAIDKFNILYKDKQFIKAYYIGTVFDISRKRTLTAGIEGFKHLLLENKITEIINIENKYKILHDQDIEDVEENIREEFIQEFRRLIIRPNIHQNLPKVLYNITESVGIFRGYEHNPLLTKLVENVIFEVSDLHNKLMEAGRTEQAFDVMNSFRLLDDSVPLELKSKIFDAAEKAHHKKLEEYDLKKALFLKQKYELFVKSANDEINEELSEALKTFIINALVKEEYDMAKSVTEEYDILDEDLFDAASKAVYNLLQEDKFKVMCNCIKVLKAEVTDPKVITEITLKFHQVYEKGDMETASNLGFYFKLKEVRVKKASLAYFKSLLEKSKFAEAKKIRMERKLSSSLIEPIIKEVYKSLMSESKKEDAQKLLAEYNVKVSFFDTIIKKIIGIFKK